ncbi:MAG: HlyD family efflux transporter periplasmic adaptor subunit [Candidatus Limiplasma sp.]|nr:HlyD family efflux transporter periplasmic adaptor subunit [Candidatus Limiplasma sp.]
MTEKKKKRRIVWIVAIVIVLAVVFWLLRGRGGASQTAFMFSATVTQGELITTSSFDGSVSASRQQTLAAQTNAQVKEVFVQEGETVSENARLLRLSDGTSVSGDISGKVWELFVKPGDYVTAGASLAAILDPASFELRIQVDEYDIQSIAIGQTFEVYIPATEENVQATVSHIGKTAVQTGSTTYYEVALTAELSENALPGMQIEATMTREKIENALLLRMDALQYDTNGRVYAAKEGADGKLSSVELTLGSNDGVYVQVLSGLQEGDTVWYTDDQTVMPMMMQRQRQ